MTFVMHSRSTRGTVDYLLSKREGGGGDTHLGYGILGGKKSGIWDMRAKKSGIWGNHLGYGI